MTDTSDFFADKDIPRARVALLLKHFSNLADEREPWRVMYPLAEVLPLLTCASIASCDDFDDIVALGRTSSRLSAKVRAFSLQRSLRALAAHIGQSRRSSDLRALFFEGRIATLWPGRRELIAIDRKTSRRTHDKRKRLKALHTLSA
jgi:hypothetical protein